jgi:hypothetical protein
MVMSDMKFNGNELVFGDSPNIGVAGIAQDQPDKLAYDIALSYNLLNYVQNQYWENPEDAIGAIRRFISVGS